MWNFLKSLFSSSNAPSSPSSNDSGNFSYRSTAIEISPINPATGLPMISGYGGVDVGGSPYGVNLHDNYHTSSSTDPHNDWVHDSTSYVAEDSWNQDACDCGSSSRDLNHHHHSEDTWIAQTLHDSSSSDNSWSSSTSDFSSASDNSWNASSSDWNSGASDFGGSSNNWD